MNRIKKLLHRNIKMIIVLLLFIAIGAGVTYSATTYLYNSNVIGYNNSNSGLASTDVQGALDELYNTCVNSTNCPEGHICYESINALNLFSDNAVRDDIRSTYVDSDSGIYFGANSSDTNGKGIYLRAGTELTGHPIYYYRGAVDNNNVIFANFCWKIVRTTETGGIKIVYNGAPSGGQCTNTTGTVTQIGTSLYNTTKNRGYAEYMMDNNNSEIKKYIDNWYASNMTDYTSYLEDTVWCNDKRSAYGTTSTQLYYVTHIKLVSGNPSLDCPLNDDKYTVSSSIGNGKLTYPVALLTAEELLLSGLRLSASHGYDQNETAYLHTDETYWTMSPYTKVISSNYANIVVADAGRYGTDVVDRVVDSSYGVRPSISLKPGTTFASGNGTSASPYIVATN